MTILRVGLHDLCCFAVVGVAWNGLALLGIFCVALFCVAWRCLALLDIADHDVARMALRHPKETRQGVLYDPVRSHVVRTSLAKRWVLISRRLFRLRAPIFTAI